jgi:phenylalanyl-tRNA synthetase beta chain
MKMIEDDERFDYGFHLMEGNNGIGAFGAVSQKWLASMDIRQSVFYAEVDFRTVLSLSTSAVTLYDELSRYPVVTRDLAMVIDDNVKFEEIRKVISKAGGSWLTNVEVFDVYKNADHLGEGKKSIALRFTIENKLATLTDKDIESWFSEMQQELKRELKADIRK